MLFLSEQEMWQSITLEDVMDAIEDAYAIHKSGNYKTMAVSVYGGKQQKYGKSATFVQASSDGKLAVKCKRQVLGECSDVYIVDGKTGIAVSTHLVDLDIPYSVVVV